MRFVGFIALTMCIVCPAAQATLVAHYSFDDADDRYLDSAGGYSFIPVGTPIFSPNTLHGSDPGSQLDLDGASKLIADITSASISLDQFAISLWINGGASAWKTYFELLPDDTSNGTGLQLQFTGSGLYLNFNSGGTLLTSQTAWQNAIMNHVVLSVSVSTIHLYINDDLAASAPWSLDASVEKLILGGQDKNSTQNISASFDEIQLYNTPLNASHVSLLFNNPQQTMIPEPGVFGLVLSGIAITSMIARRNRK